MASARPQEMLAQLEHQEQPALVSAAELADSILAYRALLLADLHVNKLQAVHKHVLLALEEVPMEIHPDQAELAA